MEATIPTGHSREDDSDGEEITLLSMNPLGQAGVSPREDEEGLGISAPGLWYPPCVAHSFPDSRDRDLST